MIKKMLKLFLLGTPILLASCVDDTYDIANKKIITDLKIDGNRLTLPLGNLNPVILDSILDLESISILKADSASRAYSISLNDSLITRVTKNDLEVLKEVSKLSSTIDPISIELDEIKFDLPSFKQKDTMSFQDVKLEDVSLTAIHEEVTLPLEKIVLDPITIKGENFETEFDIPDVKIENIKVDDIPSQTASFAIDEVKIESISADGVENTLKIEVDEIDLSNISTPTLTTAQSTTLEIEGLNKVLESVSQLPYDITLPIDIEVNTDGVVEIMFSYTLPTEIKTLNEIELAGDEGKGALVDFLVKNPPLLNDLSRLVSFNITFPKNYELALCDDESYYKLEDNTISVENMPADSEETHIRFYLKKLTNLNDFIQLQDDGTSLLELDETVGKVDYSITYKVSGKGEFKKGTTMNQIQEGLTYSLELNSAFKVKEVYGDINPIQSTFSTEDLDFSFTIEDLDYITHIDRVELDPKESILNFTTDLGDFGGFDLDENSEIILSLPSQYEFADEGMTYPVEYAVRMKDAKGNFTNEFKITSINALKGQTWAFPVKAVNFNSDVKDGALDFNAKASIYAVSEGKKDFLTIGGMNDLALMASTALLCKEHNITFAASPVALTVIDVIGKAGAIEIPLEEENFDLNFEIADLEYIESVDYVKFSEGQTITITSSADSNFGDINFTNGNYIALYFPAEYKFDASSNVEYDDKLGASFIKIDDLSKLANGKWTLALQRININKEVADEKLSLESKITMKAVNDKNAKDVLYVKASENGDFSLLELKKLFGTHDVNFAVNISEISIDDVEGDLSNIDVDFEGEDVNYDIVLESLKFIDHIGNIDLKTGHNYFKFKAALPEALSQFNLASNSIIEFIFPEDFILDPKRCTIPTGAKFVENENIIRITDLRALNEEWSLAIQRIGVNTDIINETLNKSYNIRIVGHQANGEDGLTITAPKFQLSKLSEAGGKSSMVFSLLDSEIVVDDVQASINSMDFEFETQTFDFPVKIEDLDMVKEIKYITFEKDHNKIALSININNSLSPFDLAENSKVKISLPKGFVLAKEESQFAGLEYDDINNAIYVNNIASLENCQMVLAIDTIHINQTIEDGLFDWKGEISVSAVNTDEQFGTTEGKLCIAGIETLLSEVQNVMGDKIVTFDIPDTELRIGEAVVVSDKVETKIYEVVEIPLDEVLTEPIDRIDAIGFKEPVDMTLKLTAGGLESVNASLALNLDIALPSVFSLTSLSDMVQITKEGLHIETTHNFNTDGNSIELALQVNGLDFTKLEEGYLSLLKTEEGGRRLKFDSEAKIEGSVSMAEAQLSSDILNSVLTLDIAFEMGEVVLKDFTGIYGGNIDPVIDSFELGIEDGFTGLKENGLTLSNTKPELMLSLYNSIGVPVNIDLSIVGRDKKGNAISSSTIETKGLYIKPAKNVDGTLTADTTRWLFTSNASAQVEGYETIHIPNLDSLLNELPYSIDFELNPQIVTKGEGLKHYVDLSQPLELGGSYSISIPFDLEFAQSIPLEFGEEADAILRNKNNNLTLANPQLALSIHNPIAQDLVFDLSIIGQNANGKPISTACLVFDDPFVLAAGQRNEDGTITPKATRWLFAVSDSITKQGYETKVAPTLGTLLNELPHKIDIALNAHFNTDLTAQIDYNNDLELACEYGILVPLQFDDLHLNYADTISEIKLNLEETLSDMGLSVTEVELAVSMNLKNTLPLGLTLNLTPLDANGKVIEDIEIGSIEVPAGDGSAIGTGEAVKGTPVELSIKCASSAVLADLDKIIFQLDVASGNGDNALSGAQGLQVSDIVLQIMCDLEMSLSK